MAWICFDLDKCLLQTDGVPMDGAVEAVLTLQDQGHRLTVYTSRFAPMPDVERNRLKGHIESELTAAGFPPLEVWVGTSRPAADAFIGANHITFDGHWGLALAQLETMLQDSGLVPLGPDGEVYGDDEVVA